MVSKKDIPKENLIKEYLDRGKSLNEVARVFNVSYNTLRQRLIENNIPIRKHSEQTKLNYKRGLGRGNFLPKGVENNPKFFYVIGAIQGDGHLNKSQQQIQINVKDKDFLEFLKSILNELIPSWNIKIIKHTEKKGKVEGQWRINICSRDFYRKFNKFSPKSNEDKIWFLKGMYDAEGSVSYHFERGKLHHKNYRERNAKKVYDHFKKVITLSQKSINDLKLWASYHKDLSIPFYLSDNSKKIRKNPKYLGETRESAIIIRTNEGFIKFYELIGFRINRKQERLNYIISRLGKSQVTHDEKEKITQLYNETNLGTTLIGLIFDKSKSAILEDFKRWNIKTDKHDNCEINELDIIKAEKICNKNFDYLKKYLPYSEQDLIKYLQKLSENLNRTPTTIDIDKDKSGPSVSTFMKIFGCINNAFEKAGLEVNRNFYSDEELLKFIKDFYKKYNRVPEMREMDKNGYPHYSVYFNRFKTWNNAIQLAGLKPKRIVLYTKEDLKKIMLDWIKKNNREPKQIDFLREKISPNPKVFIKNLESWKKAIIEAKKE